MLGYWTTWFIDFNNVEWDKSAIPPTSVKEVDERCLEFDKIRDTFNMNFNPNIKFQKYTPMLGALLVVFNPTKREYKIPLYVNFTADFDDYKKTLNRVIQRQLERGIDELELMSPEDDIPIKYIFAEPD